MKKLSYLIALFLTLGFAGAQAQNCSADFMWSDNGLTVNFTDSSTSGSPAGTISTWSWDFGDSSALNTSSNPSHTYTSGGSYYVCLTITDNARCTSTHCDTVTVTAPVFNCNVSYTYSADSLNDVSFIANTNLSGTVMNPVSYDWDFGDGSTGTGATATHGYSAAGSYGVTLTVSNSIDTCFVYDTIYVNYCSAFFNYTINSGGSVSFSNLSSGSAFGVGYDWDFGDSTTSNNVSPSHTYASSGTYWVTLTLDDTLNGCTSSFTDSIVIVVSNVKCAAGFDIAKDSSTTFRVILYNTSTNASTHTYSWDYGDGTTGSGRTPSHTYQSFGSYKVCITVDDTVLNCVSTYCDTVGMDSLGNLKAGFGIVVKEAVLVGIEDEESVFANLNVYPNPATNQINVDLTGINDVLNIRVMDLAGRQVIESRNNLGGNIETIDISALNKGIYFMVFDNGSTQKVKKFIVTN